MGIEAAVPSRVDVQGPGHLVSERYSLSPSALWMVRAAKRMNGPREPPAGDDSPTGPWRPSSSWPFM